MGLDGGWFAIFWGLSVGGCWGLRDGAILGVVDGGGVVLGEGGGVGGGMGDGGDGGEVVNHRGEEGERQVQLAEDAVLLLEEGANRLTLLGDGGEKVFVFFFRLFSWGRN